jgi:hypothetical protein
MNEARLAEARPPTLILPQGPKVGVLVTQRPNQFFVGMGWKVERYILWIFVIFAFDCSLLWDTGTVRRGVSSFGVQASSLGDYEPRQSVKRMHNMPHLDSNLNAIDNTFDITNTSYILSLVIFPAILGAIGLLTLIGYLIGILFRWCCCCCRCCNCFSPETRSDTHLDNRFCCYRWCCHLCCCCCSSKSTRRSHTALPNSDPAVVIPKGAQAVVPEPAMEIDEVEKGPSPTPSPPQRRQIHDKRNLTIIFLSCIAIILSFDLTILAGNASINRGVTRGIDAVDFVGDVFQRIISFSLSLSLSLSLSVYLSLCLSLSLSVSLCLSLSLSLSLFLSLFLSLSLSLSLFLSLSLSLSLSLCLCLYLSVSLSLDLS